LDKQLTEKKIPAKYRAGIKESADGLFARLMTVRSNVISEYK